ncbi:MAG: hypothetical protein ACKOZN_08135 [Cyanobium sp.]
MLDAVLSMADVRLGGDRPWDLQLNGGEAAQRLVDAVLQRGSLGLGDSYVDGLWSCAALDELFTRLLLAQGNSQWPEAAGCAAPYGCCASGW